jgi:hypothetical protein
MRDGSLMNEDAVLGVLRDAERPLRTGEIAELTGIDKKRS